jgi:hypothetical protein
MIASFLTRNDAARNPGRFRLRELKRDLIAHLATLDFIAGKENVIFLGPPGTH